MFSNRNRSKLFTIFIIILMPYRSFEIRFFLPLINLLFSNSNFRSSNENKDDIWLFSTSIKRRWRTQNPCSTTSCWLKRCWLSNGYICLEEKTKKRRFIDNQCSEILGKTLAGCSSYCCRGKSVWCLCHFMPTSRYRDISERLFYNICID